MEKRLMRSSQDVKIAGVCAGVANFFDIDPTIVRVVWGISFFVCGVGLVPYILCWVLLPVDNASKKDVIDQ